MTTELKLIESVNSPALPKILGDIVDRIEAGNWRLKILELGTSDDEKLSDLVFWNGQLATAANNRVTILQVAATAACWLNSLDVTHEGWRGMVTDERLRQRELFTYKKIGFACWSAIVSPLRKHRVLTEEIGEVAQAIDKIEMRSIEKPRSMPDYSHLITELVQVIAVCVAWLESMEGI